MDEQNHAYFERTGDREEDCFDAIVVGSGYGGSVAACQMSMAGIKVCLLEKGRKWNAEDFPTDTLKMLSAARIENQNLGITFGPKESLFQGLAVTLMISSLGRHLKKQVYIQNDSLAAVACGLGGGSLVNAGVMLSAPVRARRNPKWPKEWERDWDVCEANAAAMLRIQSIPVKFPVARVMDEIVEADTEESLERVMKVSVNFDVEELPSSSMKLQQMNSCVACGNCLSGCPYNAKNSTDKNYLQSAIQAGCTIRTECRVKFVVENTSENFQQGIASGKQKRWRVYLNEVDYITSDFVVLSAGVFGTNEILFQSQMRGLRLSEALGSGFSCNGNNVAYLAASAAPLNGYGLDRELVPSIPFQERPGPSISSSYTSSLGFTIQSAVLPTAYPYMLFKGITTYGWLTGPAFLHGIIDKLRYSIGLKSTQAMVLNAMGYDDSDGKIMFDRETDKMIFTPPQDPLLPRKVNALQKIAKKLGGILLMSKYRSTSVHLLGGCSAASDSLSGLCNHSGQVFDPQSQASVHEGLYVCDASLIPCSVGVNPSLTIATVAEHVSKSLVQEVLKYQSNPNTNLNSVIVDQSLSSVKDRTSGQEVNSTVQIKETMRGYVGGMPCTAHLIMKMISQNHKGFGQGDLLIGGSDSLLRGKVGGYLVFKALEKDKIHIIDGEVDMCVTDDRTPYTQYMHYRLLLAASSGSKYVLEGKKTMSPHLFALYAWKETTTLHVTFKKLTDKSEGDTMVDLRGELRVSFIELLKSIMTLNGKSAGRFINVLLQTLVRTYVLQIPRGCLKDSMQNDSCNKPYPESNLHSIRTEDGCMISCRQWKCTQNQGQVKGEKQPSPVLLLNGYSTESYALPTEKHDLVRTLLEQGHEIWLLQPRLHPLNPANSFSIDDLGMYDIPAAINKILELHGLSTKIHVVAHCVGGVAIHIALMGGHVKASNIASLTCTSSSMFFKLASLPRLKMWLPLLPITMAILGKNTILPILGAPEASFPHRLLKAIAGLIPRYERCSCKECEIFSGIFGNAFWHENVSPTLHQWLYTQSFTELPMGGFPHLRKICNSGFIVDSKGNNSYMIHSERMAVSTLYISGRRTVLVTPETTYLANKFMKLHQPGFRHERVVVEGYGHSDLLIGEKSHEEVFPHIVSHIKRAEVEENGGVSFERKRYSKEALDWGVDPYGGVVGFGGFAFCILAVICFVLFLCWF